MFKKPFSFEGRIRRTEYGLSYIIFIAFAGILGMMMEAFSPNDVNGSIFILMGIIPAYWFLFAQGAKRCHDRGNSGWFQLIPFYGLWMLFADSDVGQNEYGLNPKGIGNFDEIDQIGSNLS